MGVSLIAFLNQQSVSGAPDSGSLQQHYFCLEIEAHCLHAQHLQTYKQNDKQLPVCSIVRVAVSWP